MVWTSHDVHVVNDNPSSRSALAACKREARSAFGHRVTSHDEYTHQILSQLENGDGVSQRTLSRSLGIALGLTNLLIRKLVHRGFIRIIHVKPNRVRYLLTPAGIAEKARMSREILEHNVRFYKQARDRIRQSFERLSAECAGDPSSGAEKRIVFYGAGEVAEIGYICLQGTDLHLVGVVDERAQEFFGVPVHPSGGLHGQRLDDQPFDRLVVMSFGDVHQTEVRLGASRLPAGPRVLVLSPGPVNHAHHPFR